MYMALDVERRIPRMKFRRRAAGSSLSAHYTTRRLTECPEELIHNFGAVHGNVRH
jgi:hypothetical protein